MGGCDTPKIQETPIGRAIRGVGRAVVFMILLINIYFELYVLPIATLQAPRRGGARGALAPLPPQHTHTLFGPTFKI